VAPFRLKHSGGKKVSVTLTAGDAGLVTGSATWTSTSPPAVRHNRCLGGTTKVWPSNYINGPDPLTFHFAFGGTHSFTDARGGTDIALDSVGAQHK
jgi:hypothetical protein